MIKKVVWHKLAAIISLIALTFVVYAQVLHFGFVYLDDGVYVTQNSHVLNGLSVDGIKWAFTSTYAGFWHPITWLSLMLDTQFYGTWVGGYHLTNLLLHIASSLLLLNVFHKMTGSFWRSWFVAALFALHPLHVESVAWIAERKDVLSVFWGMLTIYAYIFYSEHPGIKRYLIVLILFFLGLMSKPIIVTLPFVLLLLDYWPLRRLSFLKACDIETSDNKKLIVSKTASAGRLIFEKIPLLILVIPMSMVTFFAERQFGALPSMESFPLDIRLYNSIISYVRYIEKAILPLNLSVYYPHPGMWPMWQVILAGSVIVFLSFLILRKLVRYPYLTVGWLWYMGTLVPVIGLIQVGPQAMADRYAYIPLIGLSIIMAWGVPDLIKQWPYKKMILGLGATLLIVIFSFLSWQRCQLWGDNIALWNDVLKKNDVFYQGDIRKNNMIAFAYNFRGLGYAERGNYRRAIEDYNTALNIDGKYSEALNNRANIYGTIGKNELAFRDFDQIIRHKPNNADAYYNRGILYNKISRYDLAVLDFTSAIKFDSYMADAFLSRGIAFGSQKQYNKALADFSQAVNINRNLYQAYFNRGIVYNIYQQYDLAVEDFTSALRIKPDNAEAHNYIGRIFVKMGKYEEAATHFKKVLQIKPGHVDAEKNLRELSVKIKK